MIIKSLETLYQMFDSINKKYYQNKLNKPMITIQTNSFRNSNIMGWCSTDPIWIYKDESKKDVKRWEINICAETLKNDILSIAETLQHEIVHLANAQNEIVDCKKGKHNEHFKNLAEKVDLKVEKRRGVGWGITEPTENFIIFVVGLKIDSSVFDCYRDLILKEKIKRKKKMFKYICPGCKETIKAKMGINVMCEDCNQEFIFNDEVQEKED